LFYAKRDPGQVRKERKDPLKELEKGKGKKEITVRTNPDQ